MARRFLAAGLLIVLASPAHAGDADHAKFLLKHGRAAISKGDYNDAVTKLSKALVEDPTLIEVIYWIAVANEKGKRTRDAARAYREFRKAAEVYRRSGQLGKERAKLVSKAASRLKSIDPAGVEIEKSQAGFANRLLALAKTHAATDEQLALRVLRILLRASPEHADANELLGELEGQVGPTSGEFDGVKEWQNLIANSLFGRSGDWTYFKRYIAVDAPGGSLLHPPGGFDTGPAYVYRTDYKLEAIPNTERRCTVGLIFGLQEGVGFGALMMQEPGQNDRVALANVSLAPPKHGPIKVVDIKNWKPGMIRQLAVLAEGNTVKIFVDGELKIEHAIEGRKHLGGDIGLSQQNVRMRMAQFKFGKIEGDKK